MCSDGTYAIIVDQSNTLSTSLGGSLNDHSGIHSRNKVSKQINGPKKKRHKNPAILQPMKNRHKNPAIPQSGRPPQLLVDDKVCHISKVAIMLTLPDRSAVEHWVCQFEEHHGRIQTNIDSRSYSTVLGIHASHLLPIQNRKIRWVTKVQSTQFSFFVGTGVHFHTCQSISNVCPKVYQFLGLKFWSFWPHEFTFQE